MEILGKAEQKIVVGHICDICGKDCNKSHMPDMRSDESATLYARWGYFSNKDCEVHQCDFCEDCFDRISDFIESIGGKIRIMEYAPILPLSDVSKKQGVDYVLEENLKKENLNEN